MIMLFIDAALIGSALMLVLRFIGRFNDDAKSYADKHEKRRKNK